MNSTAECLKESTETALERLDYLNLRIQQRKRLDNEIENLHDLLKRDFQYISSLLDSAENPPVPVSDVRDAPAVKDSVRPTSAAEAPDVPPTADDVRSEPVVESSDAPAVGNAIRSEPAAAPAPYIFGMPRPVLQLDENGTVIRRFYSGKAAARATGVASTQISRAARTHCSTKEGSFWRFEDNRLFSDNSRPVLVVLSNGKVKCRYESAVQAAKDMGVPVRQFQIVLHTITHWDEKRQLYFWYEDEYNAAHGVA